MRLHLDGVVDRDIRKAAGEGGRLVEFILRRGQEHDVIGRGERVAVRVAQIAVGSLPKGDKLRAVFHAECDILVFVYNVARADLLAVEVDGDPFEVLVDDEVKRLPVKPPAAGIAGDITERGDLFRVQPGGEVFIRSRFIVRVESFIFVGSADNDADGLFRRVEDDIVAVFDLEIDLVDRSIVQNGVVLAVDENVPGVGDFGLFIGAEVPVHGFTVHKRPVDKLGVPFGAGRGRDADGRDAVAALVDERNGDGLLLLLAAAGQRKQHEHKRKQQAMFLFHMFPPSYSGNRFRTLRRGNAEKAPPYTLSVSWGKRKEQ